MALTDSYASVDEYRASIKRSDNSDDIVIERDLEAISRYLDLQTGYSQTGFNQSDAGVERILQPDPLSPNPRTLWVPPLAAAPTSVKIDTDGDGDFSDETTLDLTQPTGDVLLKPTDWNQRPVQVPINQLELTRWGSYSSWPNLLVQVTGTWGWPAVPERVRAATIELTALLRLETPRATEQITEVDSTLRTSASGQAIVRRLVNSMVNTEVLL